MISNAELQYVNSYARYAPYPGKDYAINVMDSLQEAYNLFMKIYNDKRYSLILSNGEEIDFEIQSKNLCHMLGIDFQNLRSEAMEYTMDEVLGFSSYNKPTSIDLLTRIIDRAE